MPLTSDRIKTSAERAMNLSRDKEALAVLALNDAAARDRQGRFYYLPVCSAPNQRCLDGQLKFESIVPNLLYVHHSWTEGEAKGYWQCDDVNRYLCIQGTSLAEQSLSCSGLFSDNAAGQILAQIRQVDVLPIVLIVQDFGVASLEWPTQSTARIVIYGPGPWYKLSWMREWIEKASKTNAGDGGLTSS